MTILLFPDNTVLINFARMKRVDLFATLAEGRGAWTLTMEGECAKSAGFPEQETLAQVRRILGASLVPTRQERVDTATFRTRLASPGDSPTAHLGEAETFAVILGRQLDAVFVTDDFAAARLATSLEIRSYGTIELICLLIKARRLDVEAGWANLVLLQQGGRVLPRAPRTFGEFERLCS